jgi:hypothetical protein
MKLQYVWISDTLPMMARTINRNTIIYIEADATKIYMGLNTWKQAPEGKIFKSDVTIAKII